MGTAKRNRTIKRMNFPCILLLAQQKLTLLERGNISHLILEYATDITVKKIIFYPRKTYLHNAACVFFSPSLSY